MTNQVQNVAPSKGFWIGKVYVPSLAVAAPMAGVTDSTYRRILLRHGAGMVTTEMISAKGLHYQNENTHFLLHHEKEEQPIFCQIFGSDPVIMAEQAKRLEEQFDGIDINMGCPAPKIVKNHEGSALLSEPELVGEIVSAVAEAVSIPVTVKIRKGRRGGEDLATGIAKVIEQAGAAAICVHGRTAAQMYSGTCDKSVIKSVKEAVSIPVIGNGDIKDGYGALSMMEETGCDAVMIGRAIMGNPWVFDNINAVLSGKEPPKRPSEEEVLAQAMEHARMLVEEKGEYLGIRQMRSHLLWYMKGLPGAVRRKLSLEKVTDLAQLEQLLKFE